MDVLVREWYGLVVWSPIVLTNGGSVLAPCYLGGWLRRKSAGRVLPYVQVKDCCKLYVAL